MPPRPGRTSSRTTEIAAVIDRPSPRAMAMSLACAETMRSPNSRRLSARIAALSK